MQAFYDLPLILGVLGAQPEYSRAKVLELDMMIAEGARLWCASTGAGNQIPARWRIPIRLSCSRVAVNHGAPGKARKVGLLAGRR